MRSIGAIAFVLSVILAGTITWLNLSWKTIQQFTNEASTTRIDYYLSDFTLTKVDTSGNITYQLSGEHLVHKQAGGSSEIYDPHIKHKSPNGKLLTIDSEKAIQTGKGGSIILTGNVKVQQTHINDSPSFTLLTGDLTYNPAEQKLSSPAKTTFTSSQGAISGIGFDTKLDDQELRILSNVQSEFKPAQ